MRLNLLQEQFMMENGLDISVKDLENKLGQMEQFMKEIG